MKKLITIVSTLIYTALYAQTGNFQDLLNKGKAEFKKEFEQQDYKKAAQYLEQAVNLQPNNAEARYFLGYAYSRINAKDGLKMIEMNLDLLYKSSEQFEKVIALSPKYTGEIIVLDPYSKLTAEWGSMAMKYLCLNKVDSARWAFREGKKRGGFSDFMLDINRKTLDVCNSSTAILMTAGDNSTFPLYYLQTVEKYRPNIAIVDVGLLQTQWYFDFLKNNNIVDFSLSSREYAAMDEIIKWEDTEINIYALTWTIKPSYYGRYITRSEKAFLDLLKKNEFYKRNVFFTAGFPEDSRLSLNDYLMPMVLVDYVSPANPSYVSRNMMNPASYYETVFPNYLKTAEKLNMNSPDEREMFDYYVRLYLLKEITYYLKIEEITTAKKLFDVLDTFADNKKYPYLDGELNEYVDYLKEFFTAPAGSVTTAKTQSKTDNDGVIINGVMWATRNVDKPGIFAEKPESLGMFYQWNRKIAWASTGWEAAGWDNSYNTGTTWQSNQDPSPEGWRMPTLNEIKKLLDSEKVKSEWIKQNGVMGRKFTDKTTGNSIFLPAAGLRHSSSGELLNSGKLGSYWSNSPHEQSNMLARYLTFDSENARTDLSLRGLGLAVRSVAATATATATTSATSSSATPRANINRIKQVAGEGNKNLSITAGGVDFEMIWVEGGTFTMGCTAEQGECRDDAKPAHKVTLPNYYMSEYLVTQKLWQAVMGTTIYQQRELSNPNSALRGVEDNLPMYYINYDECEDFCKKLNELLAAQLPAGYKFALPTEAQWEYAARGGKQSKGYKYSGSNNAREVAWFRDNSRNTAHQVGTKVKNELGLYDMSGNLWEWCRDLYNSKYYAKSPSLNPQGPATASTPDKEPVRVIRGGSWYDSEESCLVAHRSYNLASYGGAFFGLRLVLVQ